MKPAWSAAMLMTLAACGGDGQQATTGPIDPGPSGSEAGVKAEQAFPAPDRAPPETLDGEWRIAGIDGVAVNLPVGLALSADRDELWWEPRCAGMVRSYAIEGSRIAIAPVSAPPPPADASRPPHPAVCAIGLPPGLSNAFRSLDSASRVETTAENGVRLSGRGHSITLFAQ